MSEETAVLDDTQDEVIEDEAPEQELEASESGDDTEVDEEAGEEGEQPSYEPNFNFKFHDQEYEFDEFVREAIKDEESEKKMRELYEKAYGLTPVKEKLEKVRGEFGQTKEKLSKFENSLSELQELYQMGDFDQFFEKMQIPQEKVLQWVADKLSYNEMPQEQKALYDSAMKARRDAFSARQESRAMSGNITEQALEARRVLLTSELAKPEVKSFADAYNAKFGNNTAFWDAVCKVGEQAYLTEQVDLSPTEAIQRVMEMYKPFMASEGTETPAASQPTQKVVTPNKTKTIPNVQGGGSRSPVGKKKPKNLDDLRKLRAGLPL